MLFADTRETCFTFFVTDATGCEAPQISQEQKFEEIKTVARLCFCSDSQHVQCERRELRSSNLPVFFRSSRSFAVVFKSEHSFPNSRYFSVNNCEGCVECVLD